MAIMRRRLSTTNLTRKTALIKAKAKLDNPGVNGVAITPATAARLNTMHGSYLPAMTLIDQRAAQQVTATAAKNPVLQTLRLFCKSFISVFNSGVERGKYLASHRPFYGIDASNSNLPDLTTEVEVTDLAGRIIEGDPLRVADGGAAMANPDVAEVTAANTALQAQLSAVSNAKDALDQAQEAVGALNPEADKVIKKVWDEVETFFNEETPESKRANSAEWGVVYVSEGAPAVLSGIIRNNNGAPLEGAAALLVETGTDDLANNEGRYELPTIATGGLTIRTSYPGLPDVVVNVIVPDGSEGETIEVPDIIMGGAPTPADVINVGGTTTHAANGAPLTGVNISATAAGTTGPLTTLSTVGGIYNLHATGVPAGQTFHAIITASFPGFVTQTIEIDVAGGNTYIVNFALVAE